MHYATHAQLWIDEQFDEWAEQDRYIDADDDAPLGSKELIHLAIANDENFLFIDLKLQEEINLQEQNNITLYIDTDANPNTGRAIEGIGAELQFNFGQRIGRVYFSNFSSDIYHNDLGLVSIPTVTSNRFEIALRRNNLLSGRTVNLGSTIHVLVKDGSNGDQIPSSGLLTYSMEEFDNELPDFSLDKKDSKHIRVSSLNCLRDQIFDPEYQDKFRRLFQATQPDIIAFQEIYDHGAQAVSQLLQDWMPLQDDKMWQCDKVNPDIITCSKYPILTSTPIDGNGAFLLQLPEQKLLLINTHLPCCGNNTDRQAEVDRIMGFVRESKAENSDIPIAFQTPIIIAGDMNFVGDVRQRQTILRGDIKTETIYGSDFEPDWDDSNIEMAYIMQTGIPFAHTWLNNFSSFGAGWLDYIFYTGSVLILQNSFGLNTAQLSSELLNQYGLLRNDDLASDHYLISADFEMDIPSAVKEISGPKLILHPNPTDNQLTVQWSDQSLITELKITDLSGKVVLVSKPYPGPTQFVDISYLTSGMYFLHIRSRRGVLTEILVKK